MLRPFAQVDVFSQVAYYGNPVAVVCDATDLTAEQMARFARWTNLSETTFLLPPTRSDADYRLRIFTPGGELPFAGHPTLGSARAWLLDHPLGAGRRELVQECGAGLVRIRVEGERLAFQAPPLIRSGPLEPDTLTRIERALRLEHTGAIRGHQWVVNGPEWAAILLDSADRVLDLEPDFTEVPDLEIGVIGPYDDGVTPHYEVRAFVPALGIPEDPVTGSLAAGLAQWLIGSGLAPDHYIAGQGTRLGRAGRIHVDREPDGSYWIGGHTSVAIGGTVAI